MATTTRTGSQRALPWAVLAASVVQAAAPIVPFAGAGETPAGSGTDLRIVPAGYAFSIWSLIYLLSIVYAVVVVTKRTTGTAAPARLQRDLLGGYLGAALWIAVSAADISWATALVLVVMTVLLVDAVLVVARPVSADDGPGWVTVLARVTVGIYAAWVTVAVFLNLASAAATYLDAADPNALGWQLAVLVVTALVALAITAKVGASTPTYALTLLWAFVGVLVTAWGGSTVLVALTVATLAAVLAVQAFALTRR
ncbi:MFS transporter [Aeromicrobium camelliae]|uniref:MFS transporter n=1 Tax=Aeromicrobium camelliae TaxID=1538144 RepID=A0A3N6X6V3_9ACTN|nr:MFS transporter [Aeromicrobium camelliae]RQN09378.1 MFS transporter [Aeromicrobium camelliae]